MKPQLPVDQITPPDLNSVLKTLKEPEFPPLLKEVLQQKGAYKERLLDLFAWNGKTYRGCIYIHDERVDIPEIELLEINRFSDEYKNYTISAKEAYKKAVQSHMEKFDLEALRSTVHSYVLESGPAGSDARQQAYEEIYREDNPWLESTPPYVAHESNFSHVMNYQNMLTDGFDSINYAPMSLKPGVYDVQLVAKAWGDKCVQLFFVEILTGTKHTLNIHYKGEAYYPDREENLNFKYDGMFGECFEFEIGLTKTNNPFLKRAIPLEDILLPYDEEYE